MLRDAGHAALAEDIEGSLARRDVIAGYWSFQLVELSDSGYRGVFRQAGKVTG